jgi:hypothetical protein
MPLTDDLREGSLVARPQGRDQLLIGLLDGRLQVPEP